MSHLHWHGGVDLATIGMAHKAMGLLRRIDEHRYQCLGWVEVALALARIGHPETSQVVTEAAALMEGADDDGPADEIGAELVLASALVGQWNVAVRHTELVLPKMLAEPSLAERAEIASWLVQAAQTMGDFSDVMNRAKATAMAEILNAFAKEDLGRICWFQLWKILPAIRSAVAVENLLLSIADRVVAGIGVNDDSPINAARSLMDLAHGAAEAGEVRSAYLVAKMALDLRDHPDIRHPSDFEPTECSFRFADFFCVSAAALAKAGNTAQANAALQMAETIVSIVFEADKLVINRRLRRFDAWLAMKRFDQAHAELSRAELACYIWWRDTLRRGRAVDSQLYSLVEIAVGWIRLTELDPPPLLLQNHP